MQAGDLADDQLADILRTLAATAATGGLHIRRRDEHGESADAVLFLRDGQLYAATAPGPRPLLGVRLVAAGAVTREALEEALESQAGELAGWRLGELLVHLGYVDADIVAEFVVEQILDTVAEVSVWSAGGWRFRPGEKTREADGLALAIDDVLDRVAARRLSWSDLEEYAGGAAAVPERISYDEDLAAGQIPLARALLAEIDGARTLAELATRCGLTTYEAGYVLAQLVESGTVQLVGQAAPIEPVATAPLPPPHADEPAAGVDLAMQLAVLARQAEEVRWTAEAHRRERITARRAAQDAPAAPAPPVTPVDIAPVDIAPVDIAPVDIAPVDIAPIGLAPVADWTGSSVGDLLGPTADAAQPLVPGAPEPVGLAPIGLEPYEPYGAPPAAPEREELLPTREVGAVSEPALSAVPTEDAIANLANLADLVGAIDLAALDGTATPPGDGHVDHEVPREPVAAVSPEAPAWTGGPAAAAVHAVADTADSAGAGELVGADGVDDQASVRATLADLQTAIAQDPAFEAVPEPAEQVASYAPVWDADPVTGFSPDLGDAHAQTDTAALLRELSFLGLDDVPPPAPAPRPAPPRPVPASVGGSAKPKRKSIFGR